MDLVFIRDHKWKLLLAGLVALLLISPIASVYDDQDGLISPLTAALLLAVSLGPVNTKAVLVTDIPKG